VVERGGTTQRLTSVLVGAALVLTVSGCRGAWASASASVAASATPHASSSASSTPDASPAGTWTATGSMIEVRFDHTATSLRDGTVLVAGGFAFIGDSPDSVRASAELYDPGSGSWTATGDMLGGHGGHTATLLPDGRVLVAGGGFVSLTSAELYDPSNGTWTTAEGMIGGHGGHIATLLPDGRVLVAGGNGSLGLLASAELYDPGSGSWTATGSMIEARADPTITVLRDGTVLVAGGYTIDSSGKFAVLASAELYDPGSGTWTSSGSMAEPHYVGTATLLPDGTVLVAGGYTIDSSGNATVLASAELFDPGSGTWTATGNMNGGRAENTATLLPDGMVLVVGGNSGSGGSAILASAELYDPSNGTWTVTGNMAGERNGHTATLLPDGTVLVAGGLSSNDPLASAELYDPGGGS
jgi:galactose oxidase-like protein/Kelch motif protein